MLCAAEGVGVRALHGRRDVHRQQQRQENVGVAFVIPRMEQVLNRL